MFDVQPWTMASNGQPPQHQQQDEKQTNSKKDQTIEIDCIMMTQQEWPPTATPRVTVANIAPKAETTKGLFIFGFRTRELYFQTCP